jgi:hypothetical protein
VPPASRTVATIAAAASVAQGSWPTPARRSLCVGAIRNRNQSSRLAGAYADDGSPNTAGTMLRRRSCIHVVGTCR